MCEQNCKHQPSSLASVVPLPTALYVSNGLIFELFDGGQPRRNFVIRWERLEPINASEAMK